MTSFEKSYRAVHNMIAQNEALLVLREHLEKAKEVEDYLKSSNQKVKETKKEIGDLEGYRDRVVQEISATKSDAALKASEKTKAFQAKFTRMRENFEQDQGQRGKDLEDRITQHKLDLIGLEDSIKTKHHEENSVASNLRATREELKAVEDALTQIKNSIGG